jgi:hypothetical protein
MKKLFFLFLIPNFMYGAFPVEHEAIESIIVSSPESSDIWACISAIIGVLAFSSLILTFMSFDGENDDFTLKLILITSILGLFAFASGICSLIKSKKRWQTIVPATIGIILSIIPVLFLIEMFTGGALNIF